MFLVPSEKVQFDADTQGLSVVDINFVDSATAQLRESQPRDTPTRVRHAPVLSPFDGSQSQGSDAINRVSHPHAASDHNSSRSATVSGALKSRSPVKISIPVAHASHGHDASDILVLRQQLAALRKDVVVLQVSSKLFEMHILL
jgi:hypothetical protein